MRDKFSELINQGVAAFTYTTHLPEVPEKDPICIIYNNIFSIATDTHMSVVQDGDDECRVIKGHIIANRDKWVEFVCSPSWGSVNFRNCGYYSVNDLLYQNGLEGNFGDLNGEVVYIIRPHQHDEDACDCKNPACCVYTTESKIPQPLEILTNNGRKEHVLECLKGSMDEITENLNDSIWMKGENWVPSYSDKSFACPIGNKTYILKLI